MAEILPDDVNYKLGTLEERTRNLENDIIGINARSDKQEQAFEKRRERRLYLILGYLTLFFGSPWIGKVVKGFLKMLGIQIE